METLLPPDTLFPVIKRSTYTGNTKIIDAALLTYINKQVKNLGKAKLITPVSEDYPPQLWCQLTLVPCTKSFSIPLLQNIKNSIDDKVQLVNPPATKTLYGSFHDLNCALVYLKYQAIKWWFNVKKVNIPETVLLDIVVLFVANIMEIYLRADINKSLQDEESYEIQQHLQDLFTLEHLPLEHMKIYGGQLGGEEWIKGHTERLTYVDMTTRSDLQLLVNVAESMNEHWVAKKQKHSENRKLKEKEKLENMQDESGEEPDKVELSEDEVIVMKGSVLPPVSPKITRKSPRVTRKEQPIIHMPVLLHSPNSPNKRKKTP